MKKRVISAIIMILIVLPIVYFGGFYYYIALGIVSILAYKEIISLPYFSGVPSIIKICGVIFYLPIVFGGLINDLNGSINYFYLILLFIYLLIPSLIYGENEYKIKDGFFMGAMITFLSLGFASLFFARESLSLFIYLISIPILSDTFAMLIGSLIGKHKLCPSISPNKTVEGSCGGLIIGSIIPLIIYNYLIGDITIVVIGMTLVLNLFSQLGDLVFSKIKRENSIKDFSNLIPGHGGILDRLDSILFVSSIYLIFSSIL